MSTLIPSPGGPDNEHKAGPSDDTLPAPQKAILDQFLDLKIEQYYNDNEDDEVLWATFTDDFATWTAQHFQAAARNKVIKLRICLREHGIRVEMDGRHTKMAEALAQVVQEEQPAEWTDTDIDRFRKDNLTVLSKQLEGRIEGAHIGARAASLRAGSSASVSMSQPGSPSQQRQQPGSPSQQHQLHQRVQLLREPTAPEMSQILSATTEIPRQTARPLATDAPTREKPQPPAGLTQTEDL
jgi:hypothetical protein